MPLHINDILERFRALHPLLNLLPVVVAAALLTACGGGGYNGGGGGGGSAPFTPAALVATAGDQQVGLTWNASSGASSYHLKRGAATGGPIRK